MCVQQYRCSGASLQQYCCVTILAVVSKQKARQLPATKLASNIQLNGFGTIDAQSPAFTSPLSRTDQCALCHLSSMRCARFLVASPDSSLIEHALHALFVSLQLGCDFGQRLECQAMDWTRPQLSNSCHVGFCPVALVCVKAILRPLNMGLIHHAVPCHFGND
jgi:hypothetical protein